MSTAAGMVAAVGAAVFFGSYSVPLKFPSVLSVDVDPLVYQMYKAVACFTSSWLALLVVPLKFTWWGIVGAFVSCSAGVLATTAVRWAGIGVAQALWSGIGIFVSYIWGAYVFREPIQNPFLSILALVVMAIGMAGIGTAASGSFSSKKLPSSKQVEDDGADPFLLDDGADPFLVDAEVQKIPCPSRTGGKLSTKDIDDKQFVNGILCAVIVGISNGSFLIPLKYAAANEVTGMELLVSYGVGSVVISVFFLLCYWAFQVLRGQPPAALHLEAAAGPGLLTGFLFNAGNVASIYAMECLGLALGWPLVQCQLLVSALWAVFYYDEVTGRKASAVMLGSCVTVIVGAVLLSQFGTVRHPSQR